MDDPIQKFDHEIQQFATKLNLIAIDLAQHRITQEEHDRIAAETRAAWNAKLQTPEAETWNTRMKELKDEMVSRTKKEF